MWLLYDVQAETRATRVVGDERDRGHHFAIEHTGEKPAGIGSVERLGIIETRIPSFRGRPVDRALEVGARHGADEIIAGHGCQPPIRAFAKVTRPAAVKPSP